MSDEHPRLHAALAAFEGVDVFMIYTNERNVLVRFDGPANPAYVFAELNRQRLTPKGLGLMLHKQPGLNQ